MRKLLNTLYINSPDRYLGLDGENIVVYCEHQEIGRVPLHNIEAIVTCGYTGISPALMAHCVERLIGIYFSSTSGALQAKVLGPSHGNVLLRRAQYRLADNEEQCMAIAKNMIIGKVFNSRWILERAKRDHGIRVDTERIKTVSGQLYGILQDIKVCTSMDSLRGLEGEAAKLYFSVFNELILQQKEDFFFQGRSRRPPRDKMNALLSFSYSLLTHMCAGALETVGLDSYVGVMHAERPGRKSLALDLVEELRSVFADRFALTLVNKKMITASDFCQMADGATVLTEDGRRKFYSAWQEKKKEILVHPFLEEKVEWGVVPYVQALLLSRYIRGDLDGYPTFMWK